MRLRIVLPKVNPEAIEVPTRCAYAGCSGSKFYLRQEVAKPLRVRSIMRCRCIAISV